MAVEESEEMQARPVYVAAVDLSCKILYSSMVIIATVDCFYLD